MPKYTEDIIAGYTLYFTSFCIVEAMHVHASDSALTEAGSAKLFVYANGDTKVEKQGRVNDRDMHKIREYIKKNHQWMYAKWREKSNNGYFSDN